MIKYLKGLGLKAGVGILKIFIRGVGMKTLIKSLAGWIKIIGYVGLAWSLAKGFLNPQTVVFVGLCLSGAVKIAEIIVGLTPSTKDDEIAAAVKEALIKEGIITKGDK